MEANESNALLLSQLALGFLLHRGLWPIHFQSKYLAMERHFRGMEEQVKEVQDVPLDRVLTAVFLLASEGPLKSSAWLFGKSQEHAGWPGHLLALSVSSKPCSKEL